MDWMQLAFLLIAATTGYIYGISKDRLAVIRSKKIEAMTQLHERVLEIEKNELSDGKNQTVAVSVDGGTKRRKGLLSDDEVNHLSILGKWRQELLEEEDRARLWIDRRTVRLVSSYFMLMMLCKSWEEFGQGSLIENEDFLNHFRCLFARPEGPLKTIVIEHSKTGEPRLVDCILLSDMCLDVIQRRVRLEISCPLFFRVKSLWWMWLESREKRKFSKA